MSIFPQASSYEFMVQNSDYQESYWYAFDYKAEQKSLFNLLFLQPAKKAGVLDHGVRNCCANLKQLLYQYGK